MKLCHTLSGSPVDKYGTLSYSQWSPLDMYETLSYSQKSYCRQVYTVEPFFERSSISTDGICRGNSPHPYGQLEALQIISVKRVLCQLSYHLVVNQ